MTVETQEWPPSDDWIENDIRDGDASSLANRVARYRFVANRFPIGSGLFMGGVPQLFAFQEMQRSYVSANYMAAVLCAQVFAEHSLAVHYVMTEDDAALTGGFASLIPRSRRNGFLAAQTAHLIHV